jgi:3-deoxy-D-manno-octulosonate 8-phosphate phosphatase (KDO 8-P phosphatase)
MIEPASQVTLLLMDVDGVLTDGRLFHLPDAQGRMVETKGFDSQDGLALRWLRDAGIETGVISGRISLAVEERARQLDIAYVYQGHLEKVPILEEILRKSGKRLEEIAYIGDDFTDIVIMRRVGWAVAPANARPEVQAAAHLVTKASGGRGAVRETAEAILKARGLWDAILRKYEAGGNE